MSSATVEENELEHAYRLAVAEPAHRPAFYALLLESVVYTLGIVGGEAPPPSEAELTLIKEGDEVEFIQVMDDDGVPIILFFTSLDVLETSIQIALDLGNLSPGEVQPWIAIPAFQLFVTTLGARLSMNPVSDNGRVFEPEEIRQLLEFGTYTPSSMEPDPIPESYTITQIDIAHDAYPGKVIDSLIQLFAQHRTVKRAAIACMWELEENAEPVLVIGIEVDGDLDVILRESTAVASATMGVGYPISVFPVGEVDSLSQYFKQDTESFYDRSWGQKMHPAFGVGES